MKTIAEIAAQISRLEIVLLESANFCAGYWLMTPVLLDYNTCKMCIDELFSSKSICHENLVNACMLKKSRH